jgi:DNA-binding NarL/FixJ family response regulator
MRNDKIKVLLVDDHALVRDGVRLMLGTSDDIEVIAEAENAQQALKLVEQHDFDVALVDLALPGTNGLDLLKRLRTLKPKLAVLILSMYAEDIYAVRALKHGAAGYLTKNSPAAMVVAAVRKVATGGKHVNPALLDKLANEIGGGKKTRHETLSERELDVLRLIASGQSLVQIADALNLSPKTITTYRARILEKVGVSSNAELGRYALESGLLP